MEDQDPSEEGGEGDVQEHDPRIPFPSPDAVVLADSVLRYEPVIGTGTGSEVVEIAREGEDSYLATTKDGCQEVVDEATLSKLPQGVARLATLQVREKMATKDAQEDSAPALLATNMQDNAEEAMQGQAPPAKPAAAETATTASAGASTDRAHAESEHAPPARESSDVAPHQEAEDCWICAESIESEAPRIPPIDCGHDAAHREPCGSQEDFVRHLMRSGCPTCRTPCPNWIAAWRQTHPDALRFTRDQAAAIPHSMGAQWVGVGRRMANRRY